MASSSRLEAAGQRRVRAPSEVMIERKCPAVPAQSPHCSSSEWRRGLAFNERRLCCLAGAPCAHPRPLRYRRRTSCAKARSSAWSTSGGTVMPETIVFQFIRPNVESSSRGRMGSQSASRSTSISQST
jgi:hypothetical protein